METDPPAMQETQEARVSSPGPWRDPLEDEMSATPGFVPGNPMDGGAWQATVRGVAELDTAERV